MNNLKVLRKRKGVSQQDIADYLGVARSAYGFYETGRRDMNTDILQKLSDYFDVSIDVILGREDIQDFGRQIIEKPVPVFEDEISLPIVASLQCGYGHPGEPFTVIGYHDVPKSYIKKYGKEIVLTYARGSSMIPTIRPGDLMVCYPSSWWDDGMIVVINIDDDDTVKRIYHAADGGIDLIPDNPAYRMKHFTKKDIEDNSITVLAHVLTTIPPDIVPIPRRE